MLTYFAVFVFAMEFYHVLAHTMIMCGVRTLPRKDLVRIRYYFFVDGFTVFISFLLTGWWKWLMILHLAQHAFYFFTWDKSYMAKRIIDWSSLDWFKSDGTESQIDSLLGTSFDIVVHLCMMYAISGMLNTIGILVGIALAQAALYVIVFNPKFAWSSPSRIPQWVEKRIGKLANNN